MFQLVFVRTSSKLLFGTRTAETIELREVHSFSPQPIYVTALPCKTQMHQSVTLCGDYQYYIVHLFITNSTRGVT